jgi:hypothetical protein
MIGVRQIGWTLAIVLAGLPLPYARSAHASETPSQARPSPAPLRGEVPSKRSSRQARGKRSGQHTQDASQPWSVDSQRSWQPRGRQWEVSSGR